MLAKIGTKQSARFEEAEEVEGVFCEVPMSSDSQLSNGQLYSIRSVRK